MNPYPSYKQLPKQLFSKLLRHEHLSANAVQKEIICPGVGEVTAKPEIRFTSPGKLFTHHQERPMHFKIHCTFNLSVVGTVIKRDRTDDLETKILFTSLRVKPMHGQCHLRGSLQTLPPLTSLNCVQIRSKRYGVQMCQTGSAAKQQLVPCAEPAAVHAARAGQQQ